MLHQMEVLEEHATTICLKWFEIIGYGFDLDLNASDYIPAMSAQMADDYDSDMEELHSLHIDCVYKPQLEALKIWEASK